LSGALNKTPAPPHGGRSLKSLKVFQGLDGADNETNGDDMNQGTPMRRERAEELRDLYQSEETYGAEGWTYKVEKDSGAYFVVAYDEDGERLGPI